jgi:outer membrane protein assembly factor BamA
VKRQLGICAIALFAACKPAQEPSPSVATRVATTARTSCPDAPPMLGETPDAPEPMGLVIERICPYGSTKAIEEPLKVGDRLTSEAVKSSIRALVDTKRYDDVRIGAERRGEGAVVYVIVHEAPLVDDTDQPLDNYALLLERASLEKSRIAEGYMNAHVEFVVEPAGPGRVRVVRKVTDGPRWTIAALQFSGAKTPAAGELEKAVEMPKGSVFNQEKVALSPARILEAYANYGMLEARIDEPQHSVTPEGAVTMSWDIREGAIYKVSKVTVRVYAKEEPGTTALKPGSVYSSRIVETDVHKLEKELGARHHERLSVQRYLATDDRKKTVEVTYQASSALDPK